MCFFFQTAHTIKLKKHKNILFFLIRKGRTALDLAKQIEHRTEDSDVIIEVLTKYTQSYNNNSYNQTQLEETNLS